jgi:formylglycine-generating enzyme required for sulfatase activity
MAKIYVSSTYNDLKDYREAVYHTLRQMGHDVIAMEDYVATDQRPVDKCLADVAACDLYVGIFAWRYGYQPPHTNPAQKSITELEYRQARTTGKTCLLFLLSEKADWPLEWRDVSSGATDAGARIQELRHELSRENLVSFFENPDELAKLVSIAVGKWQQSQKESDRQPTGWRGWWAELTATLFARRHTKRYLRSLLAQHREFSFLGRAKPLKLENIYVSLKVGEYISAALRPDATENEPAEEPPPPAIEGRTVEIPEALLLSRRLVVLGEPGSGKTTLLKYLILQLVQRDPHLDDFAHTLIPTRLTRWLEPTCHFLSGLDPTNPAICLSLAALLSWMLAAFYPPYFDRFALMVVMGAGFFVSLTLSLIRFNRGAQIIGVCFAIGQLYVANMLALVSPWVLWLMGGSLVACFYPIWVQWLLWPLRQLLHWRTRYPLPVFLTLNHLGHNSRPIEDHLVDALAELGFPHARRWLTRRLTRGECMLLLDALDEVADPQAQRRVVAEINRLRAAYGEGNQIIVTCRIAGFPRTLNGYLQLEVQALTEKQITRFVHNWFAGTTDPLEREHRIKGLLRGLGRSPGMRLLASNPLLLSLIVLLYERDWHLPERRVELYEEIVDLLITDWDKLRGIARQPHLLPEQKQQILTQLAACFHAAHLRVIGSEQLREYLAAVLPGCGGNLPDPDAVLDEIMTHTGLLRQKSRSSYDFVHLTIQEFLTACAYQAQGKGACLLDKAGDAWWREVIRLYVGLERDATALLQQLREHDLLLAAGCLADSWPLATEPSREMATAIIGNLQQRLQDETQRQAAADALAELVAWGATPLLTAAVAAADTQPAVALAALLALARMADKAMLDSLFTNVGHILRLLHGQLPRVAPALRARILALLDTLSHPLVYVPAGEFIMGNGDPFQEDLGHRAYYIPQLGDNERPAHRIFLTEYWIDKFPVTNAQFAQFAQELGGHFEFPLGKERHPVVGVNPIHYRDYVRWCGKRLPTEAQWEKAARGTDGRRYPWGNTWDSNKCNVSGRGTTPVDAYPEGASPYGCQDMAGNVYELVADWYDSNYYAMSPRENPLGPARGVCHVLRGGGWFSGDSGTVRCAYRFHDDTESRADPVFRNVIGFRGVVSPSFSER